VSRWLVGVVGLGVELHQRPHAARGALLRFERLSKTRGAQAFGARPRGRGAFGLAPLFPGGPGGTKPLLFTGLSNAQEETRSCARDQVVIARPPVLTPPMALSALSCE
jgi:hypothetical protein